MLTLYELAGADPAVRFSPHCWKTRLALAHMGLAAERRPWRFVEKSAIAFADTALMPALSRLIITDATRRSTRATATISAARASSASAWRWSR